MNSRHPQDSETEIASSRVVKASRQVLRWVESNSTASVVVFAVDFDPELSTLTVQYDDVSATPNASWIEALRLDPGLSADAALFSGAARGLNMIRVSFGPA